MIYPIIFWHVAIYYSSASFSATATPPASLKYYGFAGVDCGVSDTINPKSNLNYIDEVASFSNIAHLCAFNPNDYIVTRMGTMINYGVLPIVDISNILFIKVGSTLKLRTDYRARLTTFISQNKLTRYQQYIGGLYVADEPFWNGLDYASLETAVNYVKSSLPTPPIMFIEAYPSLDQLKIPANVSSVGFNQYQADPLSSDYKAKFASLKAKLRAGQKIMLVMDGQWIASGSASSFPTLSYETTIPNYYTLAISDPLIVGIFVYVWPGGVSSSTEYGVRNFPTSTREVYQSIGRSISRKP
jgi:hypothetical protein